MNYDSSLVSNFKGYRIKVSLSPSLCDQTFRNILRTPEKGHVETLLAKVNPQFRKRREQVSHVFTGKEDIKPPSLKRIKYIGSNVMFNDFYVNENPKINRSKIVRYNVEKQIKKSTRLYSDDLYISPERKATVDRRIKDNYSSNPIEILTPKQTADLNKSERDKYSKRTDVISRNMTSNKIKKSFKSLIRDQCINDSISKITNKHIIFTQPIKTESNQINHKIRRFRTSSLNAKALSYF